MKRLIRAGLTLAIIGCGTPALAECSESYMVLPTGECVNLSYINVLSESRSNKAASNAQYRRLFNANVTLESNRAISGETPAERERRLKTLVEYKVLNDAVNVDAAKVENLVYSIRQRTMGKVYRAYQR